MISYDRKAAAWQLECIGKYIELVGQTQFSKIRPCPFCIGNCQGSVAAGDGREAVSCEHKLSFE